MVTQPERVEWLRYPETETFVVNCLDQFVAAMPPVHALAADLMARTSSRLVDWLDHLVLG